MNNCLWQETAKQLDVTPSILGEDYDLVIVGGGYTGLSIAIAAASKGLGCCVLEKYHIGSGASGRNGGVIVRGLKHGPDELTRKFGSRIGENIVQIAGSAPAKVYELIERYQIDCDLQKGWLMPAHAEGVIPAMQSCIDQWSRRGINDYSLLSGSETALLTGSPIYRGALLDTGGGSIQPMSYLRGLVTGAIKEGADVVENCAVTLISRTGVGWVLQTESVEIRAQRIVLATNAYVDDIWPDLRHSILPMNSLVIATEPLSARLQEAILPQHHAASDSRNIMFYYRKDADGRLIFGSRGRREDPAKTSDFKMVESGLYTVFPQLAGVQITHRWGGRFALTRDFLPHLHELSSDIFAIQGYNGRGIAMATAIGSAVGQALATDNMKNLPFPTTRLKRLPPEPFLSIGYHAYTKYYEIIDKFK